MSKLLSQIQFRIQQFQSMARLEGWSAAFYRVFTFSIKKLVSPQKLERLLNSKPGYQDILFINGCALDHCRRYRVQHPMEQLSSLGLSCSEKYFESLELDDLKNYRAFILYRTPITPLIKEFISKGKYLNKTFIFDVDDLVIDLKYTSQIPYLLTLSPAEREKYDSGVKRMQETLLLCDAVTTSTPHLAS